MIKNIISSVIVAIIVVSVGLYLYNPTVIEKTIDNTIVKGIETSNSPYVNVNGVNTWYVNTPFRAATTTPCSIKSPLATTTLIELSFTVVQGTSTAAVLDIGTSTNAFATTTNLVAGQIIAANSQKTIAWASLPGANTAIIAPNQWIVPKTLGAGLGGYTWGGYCRAVFIEN